MLSVVSLGNGVLPVNVAWVNVMSSDNDAPDTKFTPSKSISTTESAMVCALFIL